MGSGAREGDFSRAADAGLLVAELGFHLLTGSGPGAMRAASEAFIAVSGRKGLAIGIVPALDQKSAMAPGGYPNPFVEVAIFTNLVRVGGPDDPKTRNHINILTANALIFCPGSEGTKCELDLAHRYLKPRRLYLGREGTIAGEDLTALAHLAPAAGDLKNLQKFLLATLNPDQS